jgi:hypothetical protein
MWIPKYIIPTETAPAAPPISVRSSVILLSYLRLHLQVSLFPQISRNQFNVMSY